MDNSMRVNVVDGKDELAEIVEDFLKSLETRLPELHHLLLQVRLLARDELLQRAIFP